MKVPAVQRTDLTQLLQHNSGKIATLFDLPVISMSSIISRTLTSCFFSCTPPARSEAFPAGQVGGQSHWWLPCPTVYRPRGPLQIFVWRLCMNRNKKVGLFPNSDLYAFSKADVVIPITRQSSPHAAVLIDQFSQPFEIDRTRSFSRVRRRPRHPGLPLHAPGLSQYIGTALGGGFC
ncbi:MAG: hypothetical protein CM1200mP20_08060 [Pseudomonadota bacterium]|nr:MAG: hypothetical protein CM1200mP20_08060 [Pseudomonadota bacterium]